MRLVVFFILNPTPPYKNDKSPPVGIISCVSSDCEGRNVNISEYL